MRDITVGRECGSARVGSNPIFVDDILIWKQWEILLLAANVGIKTFQKNDVFVLD